MEFLKLIAFVVVFASPIFLVVVYILRPDNEKKGNAFAKLINAFNWKGGIILSFCLVLIIWLSTSDHTPKKITHYSSFTVWNYDGSDSLIRLFFKIGKQKDYFFHFKHHEFLTLSQQTTDSIYLYCLTNKKPCSENDLHVYSPFIKSKQTGRMPDHYQPNSNEVKKLQPTQDYHHGYKPSLRK